VRYLLILLLTGCAATWNCNELGVRITSEARPLGGIRELADSDIERVCGVGRTGCVQDGERGTYVYYRNGDTETLHHELCHVMYGNYHTVKYTQMVIANP